LPFKSSVRAKILFVQGENPGIAFDLGHPYEARICQLHTFHESIHELRRCGQKRRLMDRYPKSTPSPPKPLQILFIPGKVAQPALDTAAQIGGEIEGRLVLPLLVSLQNFPHQI
jgi:hypothetical protein